MGIRTVSDSSASAVITEESNVIQFNCLITQIILKKGGHMKKLLSFVFVTGFLLLSAVISADDGESIFKSNGCGVCHKPETSSAGRPSLKDISQAYHGKEKQLETYFKGESEPIIAPEKASAMKRYIEKTKALSDEDRKLMVDFILKH